MTVQIGDQQNVDPENNAAMSSNEEIDSTRLESNVQVQPVTVNPPQNCSQTCTDSNEHSSQLVNDLQNTENGDLLNSVHENECIVSSSEVQCEPHLKFPDLYLHKVEDAITKPRWTLTLIPCNEFETLLDVSIEMLKNGQYENDQLCQHFVSNTIAQFFIKFYSDDMIDNIKVEVMVTIIFVLRKNDIEVL